MNIVLLYIIYKYIIYNKFFGSSFLLITGNRGLDKNLSPVTTDAIRQFFVNLDNLGVLFAIFFLGFACSYSSSIINPIYNNDHLRGDFY